ncbi:MAG: hypothetical protein E8G75_01090, partial [Sulfitobacter sp. SK025]
REDANTLGSDSGRDLAQARMLLAQAGFENGFTLKLLSSERPHYLVNYQSLRRQLAQIGVKVELEVVPHREMHKRIRNDENAIVIYVAWRPNADVFLTRFFHSKSTVLTGQTPDTNFSHYAGIDDLIEQARRARKPAEQIRFWKQAQIKILHEVAAIPLHYINLVYAKRDYVDCPCIHRHRQCRGVNRRRNQCNSAGPRAALLHKSVEGIHVVKPAW